MHIEQHLPAVDGVLLRLARVVRNVEQCFKRGMRQNQPERLAREMRQDLPVGKRAVDRRIHGADILPAFRRIDRRAGEFAIGQFDPEPRSRLRQAHEIVGADLMTEAARSTMNRDDDLSFFQAEGGSCRAVDEPLEAIPSCPSRVAMSAGN